MKIRVFADEFKSAVNKISTVVPKKTSFTCLRSARISAVNGVIMVSGTDIENHVIITLKGDVIEDGYVDIDFDNLKNVIGIKDEVIISTDAGGRVKFRSPKKSYTVVGQYYDDSIPAHPSFEVLSSTHIPGSILNNLKTLSAMGNKDSAYQLMTGIYFDLAHSALVALDGRRVGIWNLHNTKKANSFVAPGCVEPILKALIGKSEDKIRVSVGEKYSKFTGENFFFFCKNIEGEYYKYRDLLKKYPAPSNVFEADGKEIMEIAKEYKKLAKNDEKPMFFTIENNIVCSGIQTAFIQTADVIESAKVTENTGYFYTGFNPEFITDGIAFCGNEITIKTTDSGRNPIIMADKNEEKIAYILPVNISDPDAANFVRSQAG